MEDESKLRNDEEEAYKVNGKETNDDEAAFL